MFVRAIDIRLTAAARSKSSFSKYYNSGSCGLSKWQIMGGLRLHRIVSWPRGSAKYWLLVVAIGHNKLWVASGCTGSVVGPEGQPNISFWPRGPAKVCRPRNVAAVNRISSLPFVPSQYSLLAQWASKILKTLKHVRLIWVCVFRVGFCHALSVKWSLTNHKLHYKYLRKDS